MRLHITLTRGAITYPLQKTARTGHEARRIVREARSALNKTHGRWRVSLAREES